MKKGEKRLADREWRLNNLYKILSKQDGAIKYKKNKVQKSFDAFRCKNNGNRYVVLKGRQQGITTYCAIEWLDRCLFQKNHRIGITGKDESKATNVIAMAKFAYKNMHPDLKKLLPSIVKENESQFTFSNGSSMIAGTTLEGATFDVVHNTEFGPQCYFFPKKADEFLSSTLPAVPTGKLVIVESTAKGSDTHFEKMYKNGVNGGDLKKFASFFSPWYETKEYCDVVPRGWKSEYPDYWENVEKIIKYKFSDGQKKWYEGEVNTIGKKEVFKNYPTYPEEAFLASGENVFDLSVLNEIPLPPELPHKQFTHPDLKIFVYPAKGKQYVIGVDLAEGGGTDGDYTVITVVDPITMMEVAQIRTHQSIFGIEDLIAEIGFYYNTAFLGIECNALGSTIPRSVHEKNRYPTFAIYRKKRDDYNESTSDKWGYYTVSQNKKLNIEALRRLIENGDFKVNSSWTLSELKQFIRKNNGSMEASSGFHDDTVMSLAIAVRMIDYMP